MWRDNSEQQDFCRLQRTAIHRRLHVTGAVRSTTKHFYQRIEDTVGHCCRQPLFICE